MGVLFNDGRLSGRAYAVALLLTYAVVCLGVLESWLHDLTTPAPTWPDGTLSAGFQLLYLITLPIIAAVLAEVSFRGLIQTALEKIMPLWPMLALIAVPAGCRRTIGLDDTGKNSLMP